MRFKNNTMNTIQPYFIRVKYKIWLFFIFFIAKFSLGQTLTGEIIDETNTLISDVKIINVRTGDTVISNKKGLFTIKVELGDEITLNHPFYQVTSHIMNDVYIHMTKVLFILEFDIKMQKFDEVVISSSRIKKAVDVRNQNVIDYLPMTNNQVLTISRFARQKDYVITIEGMDTTYFSYEISLEHPEALIIDCFRNVQLLCKDSVFQISIDKTLNIIDRISKKQFQEYIEPCIAKSNQSLYFESFTFHNKKYQLFFKSKFKPEPTELLEIFDFEMAKTGQSHYDDIIIEYYNHQPSMHNIIDLGVWSGDLVELAVTGRLIELITWYNHRVNKKVHVASFDDRSRIITFDGLNNEINFIYKENFYIDKKDLKLPSEIKKPIFLQDEGTQNYYFYNENEATLRIYKIDLNNNESQQVIELNEERFPKNPKIMNGWLFYLKNKRNGFHKVYKVKL